MLDLRVQMIRQDLGIPHLPASYTHIMSALWAGWAARNSSRVDTPQLLEYRFVFRPIGLRFYRQGGELPSQGDNPLMYRYELD